MKFAIAMLAFAVTMPALELGGGFDAINLANKLQCSVLCVLRAADKIQVGEKDLAQAFCLSIGQTKKGSERCVYKCGVERGIRKFLLNPIRNTRKLFRALQ